MVIFAGIHASFSVLVSASRGAVPFVEVEVKGVSMDAVVQTRLSSWSTRKGRRPFHLDRNPGGGRHGKRAHQQRFPRPMTHDLLTFDTFKNAGQGEGGQGCGVEDNPIMLPFSLPPVKRSSKWMPDLVIRSSWPQIQGADLCFNPAFRATGVALMARTPSESEMASVCRSSPGPGLSIQVQRTKGVLVAEVVSGSASETSGIKAGDIITSVNSKDVGDIREFQEAFDTAKRKGRSDFPFSGMASPGNNSEIVPVQVIKKSVSGF